MIFVKIYLGDTMKNFLDKLDKYESAVNSLTEMVEFESSFDTPLDKLNEAIRDSIIKKFENVIKKKYFNELKNLLGVLKNEK